MYIVHINRNDPKTCHDAGHCTSKEARVNCISPKQMLLFEDGTYAYIHAGQSIQRDSVVYQLQPATTDSCHMVDRCHRKAVKCEDIDAFGVSMPVNGPGSKSVGEGLYVVDFEGDTGRTTSGAKDAAQSPQKQDKPAGSLEETWEEIEAPAENEGAFEMARKGKGRA